MLNIHSYPDSQGYQQKIPPQQSNSLSSENLNAGFPLSDDYPDPPKTGDTFGKRSGNCRTFLPSRDTITTKGSTGHILYKQYRQLFVNRSKQVNNEERYVEATKNSRKLTDFPGVYASPAPIYHDRRKEKSKRKTGNAVNRLDIRWYPHTSETVTQNWDHTFTYSDTDVTFRERLTGSPSRVVSTVIQLPTICNEKSDSRDKYIVKWLHSVPDNHPHSHSRCDSVTRMNSATPLSLKTVDSYFFDQTFSGKPSVYSSF